MTGHDGERAPRVCSRRAFLLSLALLPLAAGLPACAGGLATPGAPQELQTTTFCFDTVCTLRGVMTQDVLDGAVELCRTFERLLSRTIDGSDVGRINAAAGTAVEVDPRTAELIRLALGYCRESDGLFDITIGSVSELWDFKGGIVPDPAQLAAALPHVDYTKVQVEGNLVTLLDADARLDLGGIAKGYIADALIAQLREAGVTSAFVNLGGNVMVMGGRPDGSPWTIGVQDPATDAGEGIVAEVSRSDASVVTSGLYERCFERAGITYWHILDPRTGYPVRGDVVGATILSERSLDGDGLTKPLFMLPVPDALAYLEYHGVQGLLVTGGGDIRTTGASDFGLVGSRTRNE